MDTKRRKAEWMNWGIDSPVGIDIYIHTHTYTINAMYKQTAKENLVESTGNSIPYSVMTDTGKEPKKDQACVMCN